MSESETMTPDAATGDPKAEPRKSSEKKSIFKAPAGEVYRALHKISGLVRGRGLPIATHVLLSKQGAVLKMTSTNVEQQMEVTTEFGGSSGDACATVELRKLLDILKQLSSDVVATLVSDGRRCTLTAGKSKFTLQSLAPADFPLFVEEGYGPAVKLKQRTLASMIERVGYAMAFNDVRYFLNGMLLECKGRTVCTVATDGHRLALVKSDLEHEVEDRCITLPNHVVGELAKLVGSGDSDVELRLCENKLALSVGDVRILTKLVDGKFPDYERVLPADGKVQRQVAFNRMELLQALRRVELITSEKFRGIRVKLSNGEFSIEANNNGEEAYEALGIEDDGEELVIGMNVRYLADAVENIGGETVKLGFRTSSDSILVSDPGNPTARTVVMPMRV